MPPHEHLDSLEDDALLRNAGEGCSDCFEILFRRHCRHVYAVARRILRDSGESEDIVQDVFFLIFLQREQFNPNLGTVRTWISQFAYFKALLRRRYLRVRHFYKQEEISEVHEIRAKASSNLRGMTPAEWTRYVEAGISGLNPKHRRILELVHFEGYTLQEASEVLRESLGSTRNYYYRGLQALRDFLGERKAPAKAKEKLVLERNDATCE